MTAPADRRYTAEHEWIAIEGDVARVGITQYAADALGDVVYLDLPQAGAPVAAGASCGEIESTKSVSQVFAPADGTVLAVNEDVVANPEIVNSDAFGAGWLFTMRVDRVPDLLDAAAYDRLTAEATTL